MDTPTDTVTIYRWEDPNGNGIYAEGFVTSVLSIGSGTSKRHPTPFYDFGKDPEELAEVLGADEDDVRFGFASLDSVNAWFTEQEQERLIQAGGKMQSYRVFSDSLLHGKHQVVFDRRRAVRRLDDGTEVKMFETPEDQAVKYVEDRLRENVPGKDPAGVFRSFLLAQRRNA